MEEDNVTEGIEIKEETLSNLHIEESKCDCLECQSGRKHYIQILDMERYVNILMTGTKP